VPTVRTDLPAPRLKRMGDTNNYGEQAGAGHLLHPSLLSLALTVYSTVDIITVACLDI
jgi:hypothetical protein